jgi:hypothetical protein
MKSLWADLQVENDDDDDDMQFSLEQLERELAHLDDADYTIPNTSSPSFPSPFPVSAAGIIVSEQQQIAATTLTFHSPEIESKMPPGDAWQQSLEKFTALALEQEFLAADSARKSTASKQGPPGFLQPCNLIDADDYNINESIPVVPPGLNVPPGLTSGRQMKLSATLSSTRNTLQEDAPPLILSGNLKTPNNSMAIITNSDETTEGKRHSTSSTFTPFNSIAMLPNDDEDEIHQQKVVVNLKKSLPLDDVPPRELNVLKTPVKTDVTLTIQSIAPVGAWTSPPLSIVQPQDMVVAPQDIPVPLFDNVKNLSPQGLPMPQMPGIMANVALHPPIIPIGFPMPGLLPPMTSWQGAKPSLQKANVYCSVHPLAPPIPAAALESTMMQSRDIAYVIHAMLKPVLLAGSSPHDYDIQFLQRRVGQPTPVKKAQQGIDALENEKKGRCEKTMLFMKEKHTLGHITKSDVMRPRALLSVSVKRLTEDDAQEARASLWKARLYIDQGQEAATTLRQLWQSSLPGTIPKQIQTQLMKLFRVLGITFKADMYSMDSEKDSLYIVLKLSKGKSFVARLLEHALLPPKAVQVLIPAIWKNVLLADTGRTSESISENPTDARLFLAIANVFTNLPQWNPEALITCLEVAKHPQNLSSTPRMECLYGLLRRGNAMQDDENFVSKWKESEQQLMKLFE